ncbi:RepB family plasmid replication initiator protein [Salmonella enterica]|nr:RepB family plasmid replication initiator protein [Salmonella enterica]EBG2418902.1 RepB family plasmid replication initiator protein [Salmonella enterica subsp. enterica serovar Sandiego]EBS2049180.1 RepB family plasmid replication initiator protein [Salmonella enterica subsp. enterica serovar Poona]EDW7387301.1 RepB family plasmid replication initiator protein [Salmonella enterica subsp. enterica serovar Saintpaul]EAR5684120.1 RepB family plasmid replication initiator protein [Salmonella e
MDICEEKQTPFSIKKKESGDTYELTPNSNKSVQPVALLRLSVFTPVSPKEKGRRDFLIDASEELSSLEVARREGYTNVKIQGAKLGMSTDFRTWLGIIQAFSRYGYASEKITLPFTEFARLCGLRPTDINARARTRLSEALFNISSITLSFRNQDGKRSLVSHLVQRACLNVDTNMVEIVGDPGLWELYRYDHKVLLGLKVLSVLSRKETAQSLYIYFESMPAGTLYVSMKRLRERLSMASLIKDQNTTIRRALKDLKRIGYLDYAEIKKGREIMFIIYHRSPGLALPVLRERSDS